MEIAGKIKTLIEQQLEGSDKFLVDFVVKPANRIAVFIDGDQGITIDDCRMLSRAIESRFDKDQEDYELTVSSAGLDQPLKMFRQYKKNIGRDLEIIDQQGSKFEGVLVSVSDDSIELEHYAPKNKKEEKKTNTILRFSEIKSAKVIIKFGK
jgi:ribosome maturation factor RimP